MSLVLNGTDGLSDVDGSAATPAIRGTDANTGIFFPAADTIAFAEGGTEVMRIDSSGNVGIGTSSPATTLQARKDSAGGTTYAIYTDNGAAGAGTNIAGIGFVNAGSMKSSITAAVYGNDYMAFNVGGSGTTERARIDSSGNLLVGKTSAGLATGVQLEPTGGSSFIRSSSSNSDLNLYVYSTGAGAARFYVGMGGTVFATSTSISAISDATLKENVRDLETGLTEVMALRPRRFDWKNGDAQDVAGFVAQEVEQVLPELVTDYVYNKDEDGNNIIKKSLKMGDILPTLVKAIQEQQAIITALTARVSALDTRITSLEGTQNV